MQINFVSLLLQINFLLTLLTIATDILPINNMPTCHGKFKFQSANNMSIIENVKGHVFGKQLTFTCDE